MKETSRKEKETTRDNYEIVARVDEGVSIVAWFAVFFSSFLKHLTSVALEFLASYECLKALPHSAVQVLDSSNIYVSTNDSRITEFSSFDRRQL